MCGIVGHVVKAGTPDTAAVRTGMAAMRHRGPDGEGIVDLPQVCLGHRRLSVIDIAGSPQPWQSADGRYTIIFNGEIYNYLELRSALEKKGFRFRSQGDTEILLAMFICFGRDCLAQLNGMFAFAVWDDQTKELFLARDRLGKKPLYYAITKDGLVFASEIQALRGFAGIDKTIDAQAVHDFFAHQFIGGQRSIYQDIRKLPAGHYMVYNGKSIRPIRYWSPPLPEKSVRKVGDLCEELRALVDDAVRLRLRSDVPLGSFLSGGLDSSLIVSVMKQAGVEVRSFTVGFQDASFDESAYAREVADYFSTIHRNRIVDIDAIASLNEYLNAFGEPYADPSAIPTGHLCRHTRQFVTVALSGDGLDELFGGYRRYYARQFTHWFQTMPAWLREDCLAKALSLVPESDAYYGHNRLKQIRLLLRLAKAIDESPRDPLAQAFTSEERRRLIASDFGELCDFDYLTEFSLDDIDPVSQMMLADVNTYLVDDILAKVDRMSMHHSLEVRSPFLDYRIVEFACRLPVEFKIRGAVQKYLVRECYRDQLPEKIIHRGKHGFAVPLAGWFRGLLKSTFESVVLDTETPEFLNRKEIQHIWETHQAGRADNGFKLWCLLVFYYWYHRRYLN